MRREMSFHDSTIFISGAGLRDCCVYMMSGRCVTFISGRHKISCRFFMTAQKVLSGAGRRKLMPACEHIFLISGGGGMKTKLPSFSF